MQKMPTQGRGVYPSWQHVFVVATISLLFMRLILATTSNMYVIFTVRNPSSTTYVLYYYHFYYYYILLLSLLLVGPLLLRIDKDNEPESGGTSPLRVLKHHRSYDNPSHHGFSRGLIKQSRKRPAPFHLYRRCQNSGRQGEVEGNSQNGINFRERC